MPTENRSSNTEQMVSVLAPFAAVADMYDEAEDDDFEPWTNSAMHKDLRLRLGQFRQLRALLAQRAAQHQGEPVAYQRRCKTVNEGSQWRHWVDCTEEDYRKTIENPGPNPRGIIREARKLYTHSDAGEVERLQSQLIDSRDDLRAAISRNESLMRRLDERDQLLQRCLMSVREQHCDEGEADFDLPANLMTEIDAALSASAEPSAPVERD